MGPGSSRAAPTAGSGSGTRAAAASCGPGRPIRAACARSPGAPTAAGSPPAGPTCRSASGTRPTAASSPRGTPTPRRRTAWPGARMRPGSPPAATGTGPSRSGTPSPAAHPRTPRVDGPAGPDRRVARQDLAYPVQQCVWPGLEPRWPPDRDLAQRQHRAHLGSGPRRPASTAPRPRVEGRGRGLEPRRPPDRLGGSRTRPYASGAPATAARSGC